MFKKLILSIMASMLIAGSAFANTKVPAKDVSTDITNFGNNIPQTAVDVQKALQALNDNSASTPGGVDTNVQFNDNGSLGGNAGFTFQKSSGSMTLSGGLSAASADITNLDVTLGSDLVVGSHYITGNSTLGLSFDSNADSTVDLFLDTTGNLIIKNSNAYLNFGTTAGTTGYGFRDSSGTMQYKNSGGSWTAFSAGGGSAAGGTNAVQYNSGSSTFAGNEAIFSFNGTNIGIGTSNATSASLSIVKSGTNNVFAANSVAGGNGDLVVIKSTGNMGVGSITPGQKLDVVGTVRATVFSGSGASLTSIPESGLTLTDVTTNNVSTSAHGFTPKLPNDATKYLDGTGAYTVPAGGGGSVANPTGTIGLSAVNGSASSAIRSDGAPALSQAITPTWTGIHTFSNATNSALFTGGNVGIGSLSPGKALDVVGSIRATAFFGDGSNITGISGSGTVNSGTANQVAYYASTGTAVSGNSGFIFTGTNVGIGTTVSDNMLDVNGGVAIGSFAGVRTGPTTGLIMSGNLGIGTYAPNVQFGVGSTNQFNVGSDGHTVIATTTTTVAGMAITANSITSGNALTVSSSSATETSNMVSFTQSGASSTAPVLALQNSTGTGQLIKASDQANDTTPFVVDANGNVGIGTLTPSGQLDIRFQTPTPPILIGNSPTDATGAFLKMDTNGNVGIGSITPGQILDVQGIIRQSNQKSCATGLTTDSSGSINGCVASDENLKTNITPLKYNPGLIMGLHPVTYQWKDNRDNHKVHGGFIAQQVEEGWPDAVIPAGGDYKGVDPNAILSVVVSEQQVQRMRIGMLHRLVLILFILVSIVFGLIIKRGLK